MIKSEDTLYFKVYLQNNDTSTEEIRRLIFKGVKGRLQSMNFKQFCEELKNYFSELRDKDFTVSWIDEENDIIRITNDEELKIAIKTMDNMNLPVYKWYIKFHSQKQKIPICKKEGRIHLHIYCNVCNRNVSGIRYKCIQCDDYDLCSQCEALGLHSDHCMIRMPHQLQWSSHHGRRLVHNIRKFLKKNGVYLNKEDFSDECPMKKKNQEPFPNVHILPSFEAFLPYMKASNEEKTEKHSSDNANSSKETPKQENKKTPSPFITAIKLFNEDFKLLDPLDLGIDIKFGSDEIPQTNQTEQKEPKKNVSTSENAAKIFPGEGRKLNENISKKACMPDTTSADNQDTSVKKAELADEWTIVEDNESFNISHASSASSILKETSENQVPPSALWTASAPSESTSNQVLYPELPKEEEKVYHPNPKIRKALETMIEMGFSNKNALLTYLLEAEDGNINKVLDLLQPTNK